MRYTVSCTYRETMLSFSFDALPQAMTFACACWKKGKHDISVADGQGHRVDTIAIAAYSRGEIALSELFALS